MSIKNIPALWVPIISNTDLNEEFVSGSDASNIVTNVFIIVGSVLVSVIVTFIFYTSYNTNKKLFIALLSGVIFLYSLMNIIGLIVIRSSLNNTYFKVFLGSGIIMASLSIVVAILFSVIATREMRPQPLINQ